MTLTLTYCPNPLQARSQKLLAAARLAKVELAKKHATMGVDNETEAFAAHCSPCGRFPVLEDSENGTCIFESNAILRYIARLDKSGRQLYGSTQFQSTEVDMWVDYATTELQAAANPFMGALFVGAAPPPAEAITPLHEAMAGLELWLETRTFLVGERLTIADVAVAFTLQWIYRLTPEIGNEMVKKYRGAYRLYNTVMHQPEVVAVLIEEGATIGPEPIAKAKKDEKPAKKAEKKPKAAAEADEDDMPVVEEKKKPNPLDALPTSSFVLDAFKREYSNTDTRTVAAPWFFEHFDAEGFTCFWCKYKYNEENTKQFMTANLVRGWFQRMEHTRKYAFGVALLIGEESQHDLVSFWVFRGKGMPEIVTEVADTELFDWVEIKDVNAEKEKITDYFCWEGPTIPRPVLEGRVFK